MEDLGETVGRRPGPISYFVVGQSNLIELEDHNSLIVPICIVVRVGSW